MKRASTRDKGYADTPSNRLFHGEIDNFHAAAREMIAQYREEAQWIRTTYQHVDPQDAAKGLAEMDRYIAAVEQCRQEYDEALSAMERTLIARWQASPDEIPAMLAEALATGNYSRLAM
jgi:hypothetical protein